MTEIAGGTSTRRQRSRRSGISGRGAHRRDVARALDTLRENVAVQTRRLERHSGLRRIRRFVENRLTEPLPLSRVARVASLEETYFSATFSESVGVPYTEWLSGMRVLEASRLLGQGPRSLESIAGEAGFGHVRSLQRAFQRRLGLSPREVRRQVRREAAQAPA